MYDCVSTPDLGVLPARSLMAPQPLSDQAILLLHALETADEHFPPVILSSEPGMGKSEIMTDILAEWSNRGLPCSHESLLAFDPPKAVNRLYSISRHLKNGSRPRSLLVLDDFPPMGEAEACRAAKAIMKLSSLGCRVIVAMRPEAETLLEFIPGAQVISDGSLLLSPAQASTSFDLDASLSPESLGWLTHGIPILCRDVEKSRFATDCQPASESSIVSDGLRSLVTASLRRSLMGEDRRARFAMLLLGHGSLDELDDCVGLDISDVVSELSRRAPFFGINMDGRRFCCARVSSLAGLVSCAPELASLSSEFRDVSSRCATALLAREDYKRAGLVLRRLCSPADVEALVLQNALELINVGEHRLVRQAVASCEAVSRGSLLRKCAADAMVALVDRNDDAVERALMAMPDPRDVDEWRLVRRSRVAARVLDLSSGPFSSEGDGALPDGWESGDDELLRSLCLHVRVREHMLLGEFAKAFEALVLSGARRDGADFLSSLLADDFFLVKALVGYGAQPEDSESVTRASSFYLSNGMTACGERQTIERRMLAIACGDLERSSELEVAMGRASRAKEHAFESLVLLVGAMSDVRGGSNLRAHVRATSASDHAAKAGLAWVADQARIVGLAAQACISPGALGDWESGEARPALASVLRAVASRSPVAIGKAVGTLGPCGRGASSIPVAAFLSKACGELSQAFAESLPGEWRTAIEAYCEASRSRYGVELDEPATEGAVADGQTLEIRLLGGFAASVGGRSIPSSAWKRKRARTLLALLAVNEGHEITRAAAVSALWPDCDYITGRDRLYVTLGALRKALGQAPGGAQYIEGADGCLRLNPDCVHVDLDDFVRAGRRFPSRAMRT